MLKEKSAKLLVRLAEKTAVYASGKISVWNHYQPKEPKIPSEISKRKN